MIKIIGIIVAASAIASGGFWLGMKVERGKLVDQMQKERQVMEEKLINERRAHSEQLIEVRGLYEENINAYVEALGQERRRAEEALSVSARYRAGLEQARARLEDLERRWSGDSVCTIDPGDARVLHEITRTANDRIPDGVP